jgi:hypothetical protein
MPALLTVGIPTTDKRRGVGTRTLRASQVLRRTPHYVRRLLRMFLPRQMVSKANGSTICRVEPLRYSPNCCQNLKSNSASNPIG